MKKLHFVRKKSAICQSKYRYMRARNEDYYEHKWFVIHHPITKHRILSSNFFIKSAHEPSQCKQEWKPPKYQCGLPIFRLIPNHYQSKLNRWNSIVRPHKNWKQLNKLYKSQNTKLKKVRSKLSKYLVELEDLSFNTYKIHAKTQIIYLGVPRLVHFHNFCKNRRYDHNKQISHSILT